MRLFVILSIVAIIGCTTNNKTQFDFLTPNKKAAEAKWREINDEKNESVFNTFEFCDYTTITLRYNYHRQEITSESWTMCDLYQTDSLNLLKYLSRKSGYSIGSLKIVSQYFDNFDYSNGLKDQFFILQNNRENGILFDCYIQFHPKLKAYCLTVSYSYLSNN